MESGRVNQGANQGPRAGMIEVTRFGVTSRFDRSPWPDEVPSLYQPFLRNRFYEQGLLDHVRRLHRRGVYVDAGSCLGTHTVWFARYCPSTRVHAFDPRPQCAGWTQMNVDANDLGGKVAVHQLGLSDHQGQASSRLERVRLSFPVQRMDRIVRGRVAVIKVDVEGMEAAVLAGAGRILRRHRPVVFAEAFTDAARQAVEAVLAPYGYRPTGRVFNDTPTYEFVAPPTRWQRLRRQLRHLPKPIRDPILAAWRRIGGITRRG